MNLILITKTFEPINHGPAKFAHQLLRYCKDRNIKIKILAESIETFDNQTLFKIPVNYSRLLRPIGEVIRNFTYYHFLQKHLNENEKNLVIFNHAAHALYTCTQLSATSKCIIFINDNENSRTSIRNSRLSKEWIFRFTMRYLEQFTAKQSSKIISCSEALKTLIHHQYQIPKEKIYTVYQGVDLNTFTYSQRSESLSTKKEIKILFVKSDYVRGGLFVMREALKLLAEKHFRITVAGPWLDQKENIEEAFSNCSHCTIDFLGPVSENKILHLLYSHDIFCLPSIREALGVANIEAIATGLPVVTTDSLGIPEVTNNGSHAWTAPAGDHIALATKIRACINQDKLRQQKSQIGRAFVEKHFNIEKNIADFFGIILPDLNEIN